ncbi:PHYB ACTIVATION TAGGED SUPPRESSOR 1 [Hibiscus trionum]|uniref:PHYB ACTIVATION TAGGED SUPPRESSOR 1 n=1 Tax=Hibiscus trionum TaxID=183268 RepID=A0A9W7I285_HIBTR|nr:PHYB ACTIVATION TAGGED SUPPRESSOR 1 [Hibiscus trionum]
MESMGKLLLLFIVSLCLVALLNVLYKYWWIPHRIQLIMNSQGISGPPYAFIHGNSKEIVRMQEEALSKPMGLTHDIFPRVMPHVHSWINKYGKNYLSFNGVRAQLQITEPQLVKEMLRNSEKTFPKMKPTYFFDKILGNGLAASESEKWTKHRKLANHAFNGETLKNMTAAVVASVETMLQKWKGEEDKEMEVFKEFKVLASEVISRTAFGSSYLEGEKIFEMLTKLILMASRNLFLAKIPIVSEFWKSADEIEADRVEKMIRETVMKIIRKREEKADNSRNDFLGLLINAYRDPDEKTRLSIQDLVDECKTFYFAGSETTNSLLAWTMLLLAIHTDWQDRARAEVMEFFGTRNPDSEGIAKLKTITMIINETLRLYPPANTTPRKLERQVRLGKLILPAYLELDVRFLALHHDPDLWGDDVHLFKPERFLQGIAKATKYNPAAFLPFGLGPRSCVGMSFAMTVTKIAISMILQRYSFTLSPTYVHSPISRLTIIPQHGIQLLFHPLHGDA